MEENTHIPRRISVLTVCVFLCLLTVFLLQLQTQKQLTKAQIAYAEALETVNPAQAEISGSEAQIKPVTTIPDVSAAISGDTAHRAPAQGQLQAGTTNTEKTTAAPKRTAEISPTLVYSKHAKKLHSPDCPYAKKIKPENLESLDKAELDAYRERGFTLCEHCRGCALQ